MSRLRAEYPTPAKVALLEALTPALHGDGGEAHAQVAARLGTSEGAVRVALHRLRTRLRELVRDEVAQTLADPADLDDELRALRAALAGGTQNPGAIGNAPPVHGSWPGEP
jgi:hypothetical protein